MTVYLSNRDGNGKTSEEGHYRLQTQVLTGDVLGSTSLQVTQNSPAAMNVLILPGDFKIYTGANYSYTGWNTANVTLTISTADLSNPRITTVVAYVDKSASTSASPPNNPGIIKVKAVDGTPGAIPVAPSGATIQSSVGAANPYIVLADVRVNAAVTSILTANITDRRTQLNIADNMIRTESLRDSSVSTSKILDSAVTTAKIADTNVTSAKLATSSVTSTKLDWPNLGYWNTNSAVDKVVSVPGSFAPTPIGLSLTTSIVSGGVYEITFTSAYVTHSVTTEIDLKIYAGGSPAFVDNRGTNVTVGGLSNGRSVICWYTAASTGSMVFDVRALAGSAGTLTVYTPNIMVRRVA